MLAEICIKYVIFSIKLLSYLITHLYEKESEKIKKHWKRSCDIRCYEVSHIRSTMNHSSISSQQRNHSSYMTKHSRISSYQRDLSSYTVWLNTRTFPHIRGTFPRIWINIRTFPHKNLRTFPPIHSPLLADFTPHLVFLDLRFIHYSLDLRFRKEKNLKEKQTKI